MLQSKFSKKKNGFKAQKLFTDREEPRHVYRESMVAWPQKPREIVVYYGKGGIGKSRLLKSLFIEEQEHLPVVDEYKVRKIFISLDAYDYSNPVNILMAIRNGVSGDCGLFDYALLQYCTKAKMTVEEIMSKNDILSSPVVDALNDIISLSTASVCIPAAALKKCISLIKDLHFRSKYKEEIAEISELNEFEIFERLPYYLGLCISYAAEKGTRHVLFMDSYESLLARTKNGAASIEQEEWLKELFLASEVFRVIIASRDRLHWEREDPDWGEFLNQHLLYNLSDEDSCWFLTQVPIADKSIINTIIQHAGGVPLYLDMCVDLYESYINGESTFDMTPLQKGEKIIDRYIRHLSDKDKYAIRVLSVPKCFDRRFAMLLLKKQNLLYAEDELNALLEKSIILPIEESHGMWKVDESVRLHLKEQVSYERKASILESMLECLMEQVNGRNFSYLATVIDLICQEPACLSSLQEQVIQAVDIYANSGFWNELHIILSAALEQKDPRLQAVAVFNELIWLRRTGSLEKAEMFASEHPLIEDSLGIWFYQYQYMKIQIRHLLGHYDEALQGYHALVEEMELVRNIVPDHIYNTVSMKYADLLFLKGKFDDSLALVEHLLNQNGLSYGNQIELLRIKGHIYRFQNHCREAEKIYSSALAIAEKHELRAYIGKLYTNLTETLCVIDPQSALKWFAKAKSENDKTNNSIELGKALAAASAAYTTLGDTDQGIAMAKQAILCAESTGYQSGHAFGLIVLHYAYLKAGQIDMMAQVKAELTAQIEKIGVYQYLLERVK